MIFGGDTDWSSPPLFFNKVDIIALFKSTIFQFTKKNDEP